MFKTACVFGVVILAVGIVAGGEEPTTDSNTATTVDPCSDALKYFIDDPPATAAGACDKYWILLDCEKACKSTCDKTKKILSSIEASNETTASGTDHFYNSTLLTTPVNAAMRMFHFCGFTFYAYVVAMLGRF
ncbi:hypothetical protein Ddc_17702 [Ditylenchus destructor]|nr:hypothetical protein Ddc_17702 [Ditylenchus destructor]